MLGLQTHSSGVVDVALCTIARRWIYSVYRIEYHAMDVSIYRNSTMCIYIHTHTHNHTRTHTHTFQLRIYLIISSYPISSKFPLKPKHFTNVQCPIGQCPLPFDLHNQHQSLHQPYKHRSLPSPPIRQLYPPLPPRLLFTGIHTTPSTLVHKLSPSL